MMTIQDLRDLGALIPKGLLGDPLGLRTITMCFGVVKRFLGEAWLKEHIVHASASDYLGLDFTSDVAREEKTWRIVECAEMLFNLQKVEGFDSCIKQLKAGQIESTYAELETAKWLYVYHVPFRFNVPQGKRGEDYDLNVIFPNVVAAADTKCKFEAAEVDANSVKNSLFDTRDQLPKDRPGIIFVKIPAHWLETPDMMRTIVDITQGYLRGTGRIVSVKFYSPLRVIENGIVRALFRSREITNAKHRHLATRTDWDIWGSHTAQDGMRPLPDNWVSVLHA
jgi:hypothetical protein